MNKLYILGALALANVDAAISYLASGTSIYASTAAIPAFGIAGSYLYTTTGDCYSAATATTLGMNNIYHQYYTFSLTKGTSTFTTVAITVTAPIIPAPVPTISVAASYGGCYHSHIYNWMAQPQVSGSTPTITSGFGNSVVAYGYAMTGTAVTSCTAAAVVTATLFKTNIFTGAQYQSNTISYTAAASIISTANIVSTWGKVGPGMYYAKVATAIATFTSITSA